jgi:hypothetical protein
MNIVKKDHMQLYVQRKLVRLNASIISWKKHVSLGLNSFNITGFSVA